MAKTKYLKISAVAALALAFILAFAFAVNSGLLTVDSVYRDPVVTAVAESEFSVTFFDVGHGDCAYIKYGGCDILIDCGDSVGYAHISNLLRRFGTDNFDLVIATHPDSDHVGNLEKITENYEIGTLWSDSGAIFEYGELTVTALSPNKAYSNDNDNSIVVKVSYKNTDFLFTGDISQKVERELIKQDADISADVIKIAHHGSKSSSSEEFLKAVNPAVAVISVGDNYYGLPSAGVLERLALLEIPYYRTDLHGDVVIISDGEALTVITSK